MRDEGKVESNHLERQVVRLKGEDLRFYRPTSLLSVYIFISRWEFRDPEKRLRSVKREREKACRVKGQEELPAVEVQKIEKTLEHGKTDEGKEGAE